MNYTTIAIIGRPNVGKSSLFNILTSSRQAIVDDQAGVTIDRHYGYAILSGRQFIIVDTGGYTNSSEQPLQKLLNSQVMLAIEESDILLFVVDALDGQVALDKEIIEKLRKTNKPIILLANKAENLDSTTALHDFYGLSEYTLHISAAHRKGMTDLKDLICKLSPSNTVDCLDIEKVPTLAIIGRPNAGKSTLTNAILGRNQVLVSSIPGTTRDSIYIDFTYKDHINRLIDTAGLRRKSRIAADTIERYSVLRSMKAIVDADVVVLMIDASLEISEQDCRLYNHIQNIGRPTIIVLNKWDLLDEYQRANIKKNLDFRLRQIDAKDVITCTAVSGYGISRVLDLFISKFRLAQRKVSTSKLNELFAVIREENPPPQKNGKRPKLAYAQAAGIKPHRIVIHGKYLEYISEDYKRYLQNTLQKRLNLIGIPFKIIFKSDSL